MEKQITLLILVKIIAEKTHEIAKDKRLSAVEKANLFYNFIGILEKSINGDDNEEI